MEIGIDMESWQQQWTGSLAGGEESCPDWHGLRSRFVAAWSTRRALMCEAAVPPGAGRFAGSFNGESAKLLATYGHGLCSVNRTVLGDGKPLEGIASGVAGEAVPGDRG